MIHSPEFNRSRVAQWRPLHVCLGLMTLDRLQAREDRWAELASRLRGLTARGVEGDVVFWSYGRQRSGPDERQAMSDKMTMAAWPEAAAVGAKRSRLAEDLEIDGDVSSTGPIDVLGKIKGTVRAPEVLIAAQGHVAGNVVALSLSVHGTVDGRIQARSVSLAGSARVQADILHELITIETGARLEGRLKRKS